MKYLLQVLLLITTVTLISCTEDTAKKLDYRLGSDGLIYESNSEKLYTGRIIDTTEVIIEIEVVEGKKHGEFITYYLNGNVEKRGYIEGNINEGEWKYFYEDGQLEAAGNFVNDKAEGGWIFYYQNGNKKEEGTFNNGERTGKWIFFNESGEVINEQDFNSGEILKKEKLNQSSLTTSLFLLS